MDYASNFTPCVRLHYRVQGYDHSLMARMAIGLGEEGVLPVASKLAAFVNQFTSQRYTDWALLYYDWRIQGGDIWLPFDAGEDGEVEPGTVSTSGRTPAQAAAQLRFEARSTGGSKCSFTLFGTNWDPGETAADDFRITTTENPTISAGLGALTELSPVFRGIDGNELVFKNYANVKYNDAILKQIRGF